VDFSFTDEQNQLRRSIREFAEGEIAPHVMEWDEVSKFPLEIMPKLAEMGLLGVIFPEQYGGAGLGYIEYVIAIEELSRIDGSIGIIVAAHNSLCSNHIFKFGTEEQKKKYLTPLAQGKKIGAWSLTEPEAGSDAGGTRTTAKRDGNSWIINGSKTFCTNGHYADYAVVMALTDKSKNSHGISAFIVEKGTPGFKPGKKENKLGLRASDTSELIFTDCKVPAENLLGAEGEGFIGSLKILDGGRISIAALGLGMAQGALDAAIKYSKQRKQFGQTISEFQAIQFKLADMATQVEAARLLVYQAAWLADRKDVRFTRESSMAKLFASEVAVRVANECVQIHGGYGFIKDYPAEKFYRDVKLCTIGEGTSEIQKLVIARQLLGKK
jgi:alkylation response protein AidB-like acyl-CoA dehydrogenase